MASYWIIRQSQLRRERAAEEKLKEENNVLQQALDKIEKEKKLKEDAKELTFFEWLKRFKNNG